MEMKSGIKTFSINLYHPTATIIMINQIVYRHQISGNQKKASIDNKTAREIEPKEM